MFVRAHKNNWTMGAEVVQQAFVALRFARIITQAGFDVTLKIFLCCGRAIDAQDLLQLCDGPGGP